MKLLKVIKNPCTDYFPVGCKKLLMSFNSNNIKNPRELVPVDEPIVIVVGAMAHGQVNIILLLKISFLNCIIYLSLQ